MAEVFHLAHLAHTKAKARGAKPYSFVVRIGAHAENDPVHWSIYQSNRPIVSRIRRIVDVSEDGTVTVKQEEGGW